MTYLDIVDLAFMDDLLSRLVADPLGTLVLFARLWEHVLSLVRMEVSWTKSGALVHWDNRTQRKAHRAITSCDLPSEIQDFLTTWPPPVPLTLQ